MPTQSASTAFRNRFYWVFSVFLLLGLSACDKATTTTESVEPLEIVDLKNPEATPAQQAKFNLQGHMGKRLHDANCISCHDTGIYTREDRKMRDFRQLAAQVERCNANLASPLPAADLVQIADYLNQAYYKFQPQL